MLNTITVYAVLTELPAVFLLYDSLFWSAVFLLVMFAVSVWNGGGFYIEVFGRKCVLSPFSRSATYSYNHVRRFERELEALRKELADATARSGHSSPTDSYVPSHSTGPSDEELVALSGSPVMIDKPLPSITTPETVTIALPANKKTV